MTTQPQHAGPSHRHRPSGTIAGHRQRTTSLGDAGRPARSSLAGRGTYLGALDTYGSCAGCKPVPSGNLGSIPRRSTTSTDRKRADGCAESPTPFIPDSRREPGRSTYPKPHHLLIASLACWAVVVILIGVILI